MGLILGLESSCDETAASVVRDGYEVLSSSVASQIAKHAPHGGVVPELAAREHLVAFNPVTEAALREAVAVACASGVSQETAERILAEVFGDEK